MINLVYESAEENNTKTFASGTDAWQMYRELSSVGMHEYEKIDRAYNEMIELEEILDDAAELDVSMDGNYDYELEMNAYKSAYKKWYDMFTEYKKKANVFMQKLDRDGKVEYDLIDGFITVHM